MFILIDSDEANDVLQDKETVKRFLLIKPHAADYDVTKIIRATSEIIDIKDGNQGVPRNADGLIILPQMKTTSAIIASYLFRQKTEKDIYGHRAMSLLHGAIVLTNDLEPLPSAQPSAMFAHSFGQETGSDSAIIKTLDEILMNADSTRTRYRMNNDMLYSMQEVLENDLLPILDANYREIFANTFIYTSLRNVETALKIRVGIAHIPTSVDVSKQARMQFHIVVTKPFLLCLDVSVGFCEGAYNTPGLQQSSPYIIHCWNL